MAARLISYVPYSPPETLPTRLTEWRSGSQTVRPVYTRGYQSPTDCPSVNDLRRLSDTPLISERRRPGDQRTRVHRTPVTPDAGSTRLGAPFARTLRSGRPVHAFRRTAAPSTVRPGSKHHPTSPRLTLSTRPRGVSNDSRGMTVSDTPTDPSRSGGYRLVTQSLKTRAVRPQSRHSTESAVTRGVRRRLSSEPRRCLSCQRRRCRRG